jgi:hypothetical protein
VLDAQSDVEDDGDLRRFGRLQQQIGSLQAVVVEHDQQLAVGLLRLEFLRQSLGVGFGFDGFFVHLELEAQRLFDLLQFGGVLFLARFGVKVVAGPAPPAIGIVGKSLGRRIEKHGPHLGRRLGAGRRRHGLARAPLGRDERQRAHGQADA